MTCRFEEEVAGRQYPRSCPTCGLGGKGACQKGYLQDKLPFGGYSIICPDGKVYTPPQFLKQEGRSEPQKPYGPINCNVARTRNGEQRPITCERCGKQNVSDCSSSELADGCLFYTHEVGFGFRAIVGVEHKLTPAEIGDMAWGRDRAQEAVDAAAVPNVGIKLTRVQRAKIMDLIEDALKYRPVLIDIAVDEYTKRLIAILDET